MTRSTRTSADHGGKKSTKPAWHSYQRSNMTQKDRDDLRGQSEYGHVGYDPDFDGGPSAPGSKPKGKKLERQKKTGVSAEGYEVNDFKGFGESAVPGKPAEKLGAVTAIPKAEQDAARERTLAKAAAMRAKKGIKETLDPVEIGRAHV